jgi:hypothetical protein
LNSIKSTRTRALAIDDDDEELNFETAEYLIGCKSKTASCSVYWLGVDVAKEEPTTVKTYNPSGSAWLCIIKSERDIELRMWVEWSGEKLLALMDTGSSKRFVHERLLK